MIISLRGTNGAGKSTIVRAVMDLFDPRTRISEPGRRKPVGYVLGPLDRTDGLFVPGHYEIANGGIDTLRDLDQAYAMIKEHAQAGRHVLYEGKNMSDGPGRLVQLRDRGLDARVVLVAHPLEECVAAVRKRGHSISEATIRKLHAKSYRDADVLRKENVPVEVLPRAESLAKVREWLGV